MEIKQLWKPFENFLNSHTLAHQLHFNGIRKIQSERWIGELDYHYCCCCYCWMLLLLLWRFCAAVSKNRNGIMQQNEVSRERALFFQQNAEIFLTPSPHQSEWARIKTKNMRKAEKPVGLLLASNFYWNF